MSFLKITLLKNSIFILIASILLSANPGSAVARENKSSLLSMQEDQAVRELIVLDASIVRYRNKVVSAQKSVNRLNTSARTLENRLKKKEKQLVLKRKALNKRVNAIYKEGSNASMLEIILQSKSVSEALSKMGFLNDIAGNDAKLVEKLESDEAKINRLRNNIGRQTEELSKITESNKLAYKKLLLKAQTKKEFLGEIKNKKEDLSKINSKMTEVKQKMASLGMSEQPETKTVRVLATGYAASCPDCGTNGTTSTGVRAGRGIAAVSADPSARILPLGLKINVPGYGKAVIADIGGGVASNQVDLCFETHAEAIQWGKKWIVVNVYE